MKKWMRAWSLSTAGALIAISSLAADPKSGAKDPLFDDLPDPGSPSGAPNSPAPKSPDPSPPPEDNTKDDAKAKAAKPTEVPKKASEPPASAPPPPENSPTPLPTETPAASSSASGKSSGASAPAPTPLPTTSDTATTPNGTSGATENITPDANELPPDVKALEKKVDESGGLSPSLVDGGDPGTALRPTDQFSRVPLRPRMSDANWRRWAGPALEKVYRIHKGDTLWGVSDRLFGNPYLWPKVWQLNAQVANPNIISPGLELLFTLGNPNSAPELAFKNFQTSSTDDLPVMFTSQKISLLDKIDETLRLQSTNRPPFRDFLFSEKPASAAKVKPYAKEEHVYFGDGTNFKADCADGDYNVIRIHSIFKGLTRIFTVSWLGTAHVANKQGTVVNAFSEIEEGDLLTSRSFLTSQLSMHEEKLGDESAELIGIEEGNELLSAEFKIVGAYFGSVERGPRVGAIMSVMHGHEKVATLLLIDRTKRSGTFWVVENIKEISLIDDKLE